MLKSGLDANATQILTQLVHGLEPGENRKVHTNPTFMATDVERLNRRHFSVAHYFEQNGDLVPDPDVVFVRHAGGWSPLSFQDARAYREAVSFEADGTIEVYAREQRRLVVFCNLWLRNIQEQQALPARGTR